MSARSGNRTFFHGLVRTLPDIDAQLTVLPERATHLAAKRYFSIPVSCLGEWVNIHQWHSMKGLKISNFYILSSILEN